MNLRKDRSLNMRVMVIALIVMIAPTVAQAGGFRQLYLDAKSLNPELIERHYEKQISSEAIIEARASLLPQLGLSRSNTFQDPKYQFATGPERHLNSYTLTLTQPLYDKAAWGRFQQSKLGQDLAGLQQQKADIDLVKNLLGFYLSYLQQQAILQIAEQRVVSNEAQLKQSEVMYRGGMVVVTAVHESRSALDLAHAARLDAERTLQRFRQQLYDFLRRRDLEAEFYVVGLVENDPLKLPFSEIDSDVGMNINLQIARTNLKLQRQVVDTAEAGHYPTLDLSATQGDNSAPGSVRERTLTVTLNVPLFLGGGTRARVAQSNLRVVKQKEALRYARFNLQDQVDNTGETASLLMSQYRSAMAARASSNKALESLREGFKGGERTITDLLNAQNSIFEIDQNLVLIKFELLQKFLELLETTGQLSPDMALTIVK